MWDNIVTPVNVAELRRLLTDLRYDREKADKLLHQLEQGFDLSYHGPVARRDEADNIPLKIGTPSDCWNKLMKEVKAKHYLGPLTKDQLPFQDYVQSLIRLVPKAGGKTCLIFHLS